ncbi:MAG: tetratricopeptide repeat protein [Bacteroidales bacterium]|nr:tetratricopeptide repeat protein [Bacteroidales bacterium]
MNILLAQKDSLEKIEKSINNYKENDTNKINLLIRAAIEFSENENPKSLFYAQEALKLSNELEFEKGKAKSLFLIADYYNNKSDYSTALEYFLQSLVIYEKLNIRSEVANCFKNIGLTYNYLGNLPKSLENYENCFEINKE